MKVSLLAVIAAAIAAALVLPALGQSGGDGREGLDGKVLAPVVEPYTGGTNPIRTLAGGGLPRQVGARPAGLPPDRRRHPEARGVPPARRAPHPPAPP